MSTRTLINPLLYSENEMELASPLNLDGGGGPGKDCLSHGMQRSLNN